MNRILRASEEKFLKTDSISNRIVKILPVAVWLLVWQALACWIGQDVLLVGPVRVLGRLLSLACTSSFWSSIAFSLRRILAGLFLALLISIPTSFLSYRSRVFSAMLAPVVQFMKATPVASIVILVLIWVNSRNLSVVISFLMVFPVMHSSLSEGLENVDKKLLEMAEVYAVGWRKKVRYVIIPELVPFFQSGITIALGLCFKSGIAAEVIAIPSGSIGEKLYEAKIYLSTPDLFAWTVMIIILAKLFEAFFLMLVHIAAGRLVK